MRKLARSKLKELLGNSEKAAYAGSFTARFHLSFIVSIRYSNPARP